MPAFQSQAEYDALCDSYNNRLLNIACEKLATLIIDPQPELRLGLWKMMRMPERPPPTGAGSFHSGAVYKYAFRFNGEKFPIGDQGDNVLRFYPTMKQCCEGLIVLEVYFADAVIVSCGHYTAESRQEIDYDPDIPERRVTVYASFVKDENPWRFSHDLHLRAL